MLKIGDVLFTVDSHSRAGPEPVAVTGETQGLWILANGDRPNKKTLVTAADRQGYRLRYLTKDGLESKLFCDRHARSVSSAVSVCNDPTVLREIAKLVGKTLD